MRLGGAVMMAAYLAAGGAAATACRDATSVPPVPAAERRSLGPAMQVVAQTAHAMLVPWRCTQAPAAGPVVRPWPAARADATEPRRIAVFAGLREVTPASLAHVARLLADAGQAPLDAVILLGGQAATASTWQALLDVVASPAYLTVVVPGDRERVPELRDVIAGHAQRATLVDASVPTILDAGVVRLLFVGGMPTAEQLRWPVDGCVYHVADVAKLVAAARALPTPTGAIPRVVAMAAAPVRGAQDLGATGIAVGDPALAAALVAADAVVFAGAERAREGGRHALAARGPGAAPVHIALGAMDPSLGFGADGKPLAGTALLMHLEASQLTWQVWGASEHLPARVPEAAGSPP